MNVPGAWFLVATLAVAAGCGGETVPPRDQWRIHVATDAPIPELGDRLLVELLDQQGAAACPGCRRQFGLGDSTAWPLSFGAVPGPDRSHLPELRVRLYRSAYVGADGLPAGPSVLDWLGKLPPAGGITEVTVTLSAGCFGIPSDPAAHTTCDPQTEISGPERELPRLADAGQLPEPGSSALVRTEPCASEPPPGMRCVPGGSFLLGSPVFFAEGNDKDPIPERLVKLAPFFVDTDEFTVGQMGDLVRRGLVGSEPLFKSSDGTNIANACTYLGRDRAENDGLPVNCVPYELADEACTALGKRLPTEAEWEFVAGNRTRETAFPWGDEGHPCERSVVGATPPLQQTVWGVGDSSCASIDASVGPRAGGQPADVNEVGVRNLGGNLAEWTQDWFQPYQHPCWSDGPNVLVDPRCGAGNAEGRHSVRGGAWSDPPFFAHAYTRNAVKGNQVDIGFRCVR